MVFLETPLHVNTARDVSKLPWQKYLKGQQSKNNQPLNPSASLSPAANYVKFGTELKAGLRKACCSIGNGINILKVIGDATTGLTFKNCTFGTQRVYKLCIYLRTNCEFALHNTKCLIL